MSYDIPEDHHHSVPASCGGSCLGGSCNGDECSRQGLDNQLLRDPATGFKGQGAYLHLPSNSLVEDEVEQARRQVGQAARPPGEADRLGSGTTFTPAGANPKDLLGAAKPDLSLVPPAAIIYMALAMGDGANKYGPYNWREKKVKGRVYVAACMRHLLQWLDGEENAEDSGRPHLAHAMACLGIIADAKETGNLVDDRPWKGVASELISRYTRKQS